MATCWCWAKEGVATGTSGRNGSGYGHEVRLPAWQRNLLTDQQTSGGLLVACSAGAVQDVLQIFDDEGFAQAAVIGAMRQGEAVVQIGV